jgi:hypothetical protein
VRAVKTVVIMTQTRVPILRSVAAAYGFLFSHWNRVLIAAAPYTIITVISIVVTNTGGDLLAVSPVLWAAGTLASIALSASVLRMAVLGDYGGWHGLRLGPDEGRLFVVSILVLILTVLVAILVTMLWAVIFSTVAAAALASAGVNPETQDLELIDVTAYLGSSEWVVIIIAGIGAAAIMMWLSARLALALPATIANKKIQVLSVWGVSKGNAWRIALCLLLTSVPLLVIEIGVYEVLANLSGSRFLYVDHVVGADEAMSNLQSRTDELSLWISLLSFINVPVMSGLYAYLYRGLTTPVD